MKSKNKFFYFSFLALSACSDVPSGGDIEDSISGLFSECPSISVVSAKKTNGHALENGNYLVNAAFELKLEPLKENTELLQIFVDKSKRMDVLKQNLDIQKKQYFEMKDKIKEEFERNLKVTDVLSEREALIDSNNKELEKLREDFDKKTSSYGGDVAAIGLDGYSIRASQVQNFEKSCRVKSKLGRDLEWKILGIDSFGAYNSTILGEGTNNTFTMDMEMMKTENGWQLTQ